jgi:hypothetical protein
MYSKLEKMFYEQFYKKNGMFLIFFDIVFSFHPEMALLSDLGVNLRDFSCGIHCVCLRAIP